MKQFILNNYFLIPAISCSGNTRMPTYELTSIISKG